MPIKLISVCKTGGVYDARYVRALYNSLCVWAGTNFEFVCLTDLEEDVPGKITLRDNLPGWWSKIEIFKFCGPAIYFDLDTVIVGSLLPFISEIERCPQDQFFMLKAFNSFRRYASGIMAWNGDFSFIHSNFKKGLISKFHWDQKYIANARQPDGFVQELCPGVYSYKHHCKQALPVDARVICFHGEPRPHQVNTKWMRDNWNV